MSKDDELIYGVQAVKEALSAGREVSTIYMARGAGGASRALKAQAKKAGVKIVELDKSVLEKKVGTRSHQGVVAELSSGGAPEYVEIDAILERAKGLNEDPLVLLLDEVQDPHNLGALIRSAHALGAHGVVIPKNRSASVTPAVIKTSAGAAHLIPIARVTNLKDAIRELKDAHVWVCAAEMDGEPAQNARMVGPLAIVVGAEGKGVRRTVGEACDFSVKIPLSRGFDSLNVSVAGAILLYEAMRRRLG